MAVKKAPAGLPGILDVKVRYDEKDVTIRYVPGKLTVDQILARYATTPFGVVPAGPVVTIAKTKQGEIRGWTQRPKVTDKKSESQPIQMFVEYAPKKSTKLDVEAKPSLTKSSASGIALRDGFKRVQLTKNPENLRGKLRFQAELVETVALKPGEKTIAVSVQLQEGDKDKSKYELQVVLRTPRQKADDSKTKSTEVPLIGGKLNLRLGHFSDQKGSVQHFYESISKIDGVGAVAPLPSRDKPRASIYLRAGHPIDLWRLREQLRSQSIEVAGVVPMDLGKYRLRIELPRWRLGTEITQSAELRDHVADIFKGVKWVTDISIAGGGVEFHPTKTAVNLVGLLNRITKSGIAPSALWLIPPGASTPKAPSPLVEKVHPAAQRLYSDAHPIVEFALGHSHKLDSHVLSLLHSQHWSSKVEVADGATPHLRAWIADRKYANLSPLLTNLQSAGHMPRAIRLRGFVDLRIQLEFAHISGDVVYSKPPKAKKKSDKKKNAKPKKPFVPQPIAMAETSQGHQAIKKAIQDVSWIKSGVFYGFHTRFRYRGGPYKVMFALQIPGGGGAVRLDELIGSLRRAGFPPKNITVSPLFPGIPFGEPLPHDLELVDAAGKKRNLASFRKIKRPLAVAFVSLKTLNRGKYKKYKADPKLYGRLGKTIEEYKDRIDFVTINSNKHDKFVDVVKFWKETGVAVPLLHDPKGAARAVFNMQIAPPPHIFIFDANGKLRYAGEAHGHWQELKKKHVNYLSQALDLVLAQKYRDNGAVFYNKAPCNCSHPKCGCPKCGCGSSCRCGIKHCGTGF